MKSPHGSARYDAATSELTVKYRVEDACPDKRVAFPVFALTKESGYIYHVSVTEHGVRCDCIDGEIRERHGSGNCKHILSLIAVGLLPKFTSCSAPHTPDADVR